MGNNFSEAQQYNILNIAFCVATRCGTFNEAPSRNITAHYSIQHNEMY